MRQPLSGCLPTPRTPARSYGPGPAPPPPWLLSHLPPPPRAGLRAPCYLQGGSKMTLGLFSTDSLGPLWGGCRIMVGCLRHTLKTSNMKVRPLRGRVHLSIIGRIPFEVSFLKGYPALWCGVAMLRAVGWRTWCFLGVWSWGGATLVDPRLFHTARIHRVRLSIPAEHRCTVGQFDLFSVGAGLKT